MRTPVIALLLFFLAFPTIAQQDEGQPYFSLSSNRTFGSGEKPTIQLWAQGVDMLQFRVYHINDPVKFFENLGDQHRFGGQTKRSARELTAIEKFHQWKARSRAAMRNLFRAQYTAESRQAVRHWEAEREQQVVEHKQGPTTEYAGVPLLNAQQVVMVWQQGVPKGNRWDAQTVPVNVKQKGLYLVEATNGTLQAYTIVSVTDLGIIAKGSPGRVRARIVDRITGAPVADAPVVLWATHGSEEAKGVDREIGRLRSSADGMAEAVLTVAKPESVLLMARRGDDFAVASLYGWTLRNDPDQGLMGYVYTDRPVYRPGHTVHFRAILRNEMATGYQIPTVKEVNVEAQDSDGKQVYKQTLPVSAMGTVHGDITLPAAAGLGYYGIELHAGEGNANGGFQVEEYKKPEYEVKVTPSKKRVVQGESIQATIEAKYYYGEPVANAKVVWVIHRSRYWLPWYLEDDEEQQASDQDDTWSQKEEQDEQTGTLDAQGKLTIQVPTNQAKFDLVYRIEARVTDQANREITGAGFTLATVGSYYIHVSPRQYVYQPGEQAQFDVETRDYEGKAVPRAAFTVDVFRHEWKKPETSVGKSSGVTDAQGKGTVQLQVPSGSLLARAVSQTPEGRQVEDTAYVWVTGEFNWYSGGQQKIEIVPDKKSYKAGEKARVLIVTGAPDAYVWVTAEGRTVNGSQLVRAKGGSATVEIPIVSDYAPNFFVTAAFLKDQRYFMGTKSIKVPPVEQQLSVELKASKAQYRPGDSGVFTLDAKDSAGRPVAAEFSLGVVDEAIYAIRKESVQDILAFFFGKKWNRVNTDTSLSYYFQGEAGKRRMQLARIRPGKALAIIKPEKMVEPKIRKVFPDTMFWSADLRTDARGHAQVSMNFPDALTTWRATARGITADSKVGSAVERTIVRKNLILRLAVPRFFREGDEVTVSALVENYLANGKSVKVSLDVKGLEVVDGAPRDIEVPSKGSGKVDFRLRARTPGDAVLTGKALTNEESDAMELTLPVIPFGVKLSVPKAGSLGDGQTEAQADLAYPPDAAASSRKLVLSVTPSVAGTIFNALEYLTSFPYGCTEQTMSSFLPNVVVSQAVKQLGLKTNIKPDDLEKKIRAGLDRLADFQHEDGGWGWWKTDDSSEFMTAYVISGLKQALAAGYKVNPESIANGTAWLKKRWPQMQKLDPDLRAYVASVTGSNFDDVWNTKDKLGPYGLALLGLGFQQANDARAEQVAAMLEKTAQSTAAESWWKADRDPLMEFYVDASAETTAYAMKFLVKQRPQSPLLPKAALYLANHRDEGYYWSSTKQTAMVIYGLTDYLAHSGELHPNFNVTVSVNGRQVLSKHYGDAEALAPAMPELELPADQVSGSNQVRITKSGTGRVYWAARAVYYTSSPKSMKTGSAELNILRDYFKLVPSKEGDKVVHRLEPFGGTAAVGDVIAVRLTLTGTNWKYLMVEDPIPAGTEFIERDDLYEIKEKPPWWTYWFTRREFHDDRAALFQTWFVKSQGQYFYLLKVVNPGTFRAGPARAEPMYQPGILATTEPKNMEVK